MHLPALTFAINLRTFIIGVNLADMHGTKAHIDPSCIVRLYNVVIDKSYFEKVHYRPV